MDTRHLVDREIAPLIDLFPRVELDSAPIADIRAKAAETYAILPPPVIVPEEFVIPSVHGGPDIAVYLFRPETIRHDAGAILHIHGGGMVMGSVKLMQAGPAMLAATAGVPVASVEYRLAPEHPFPAPQQDCHSALTWLAAQAGSLGFDASHIIVAGESAGGGLAAALAIMARDLGGPAIAGQLLTYPMLDHRTGSDDCPYANPATGEFIWTRAANRFGWAALKGGYELDDDRRGWFSPSLANNLSNLPPAYIATGSLDLFFDENLDYARRLVAAEFKLTSLAGFVLVPFALWNRTSFLAERVLGNVVSSGIKVMVLAVIVGIGSNYFADFTSALTGEEVTIEQAVSLMLASLALFGLAIFGPAIASGLVAGAPQLGAGSVVATTALAAGGLAAGAAGAVAASRGMGAAGIGAIRAGTSMGSAASTAYKLGQETSGSSSVGAGLGGIATAARGAASNRLRAAAGLGDAAERGRQAAWNAGTSSTGNNAAGAGPASGDVAPAWAQRLQGQQNARHRRQMAMHTIRDGDRGGAGITPDINEKD